MALEQIGENKCFGGRQLRYKHGSQTNRCEMTFSVYLPPGASKNSPVPVIYWLSGLTCNDENFVQKAGAQRYAAENNVAIVTADTSPRGEGVPDDPDASDLGWGAGFYVDATEAPWSTHYHMYSYITDELPKLINANFPVIENRQSIMGHSMGGHGALMIALKNPEKYRSVSAFAPICAPSLCPWGKKTLGNYLGDDKSVWALHDTCELIKSASNKIPFLVDQGDQDPFLHNQLMPEELKKACAQFDYPLVLNMRDGYDHSYFFIASFMEEHIKYHTAALNKT